MILDSKPQESLSRDDIDSLRASLAPAERALQFIHITLLLGASIISVAFFLQCKKVANDAPVPILFLLMGVLPVAPSWILPAWMRSIKPNPDERTPKELAGLYQSSHIVGCAILESCVLITSLAFVTVQAVPQWFVAVPAFLLLAMLLRFPLPGKLFDWVASVLESR